MSLYYALLRLTFQRQFIYRANAIFNVIGSMLRVLIQISIWVALLGAGGLVDNINLSDMITYTVISLIVRQLISSRVAYTLADKVKSGSICTDLIKPINLKAYLFSEQISSNTFHFLFTGIPVLLLSAFCFGFKLPASISAFVFFIVSLFLAVILMYLIDYVMGLLVFWVKNGDYVRFISGSLFEVFSGAFIPLWFYPGFLVTISKYLPFQLIAFEPISIYLGKTASSTACMKVILLQILWILLFYLLEKVVWNAAQKIVYVQGG